MKKILGLDLGSTSIGWALVNEAEQENETSNIIKTGVRVIPLSTDEQGNFEKGKAITTNQERTGKRGARRNLQRYKLRRNELINVLKDISFIDEQTILSEEGKESTYNTLRLRAKAAEEKVGKNDLAKVLLAINKKRGYKSSRKAKNDDEGQLIEGMGVAMELQNKNITPGKFVYDLLKNDNKIIPDFYRSDLQKEFDMIWNFQKKFYPNIFTDTFYESLKGKGQRATSALFWKTYNFNTAEIKGTKVEKNIQAYKWRSEAITNKLEKEEVAYVLTEINNDLNKSSGYLGAISDRSKELFFKNQTVGQYLYAQILEQPHIRLKGQVFYRKDYENEFDRIWEIQSQFHKELTLELKKEIKDIIIFYQRRLKSQKGLISICELEGKIREIEIDGKLKKKEIGPRVSPKSSPLFQEFRIWQRLNDVLVLDKKNKVSQPLDEIQKEFLFNELNIKKELKKEEILKLLFKNHKELDLNFPKLDGNRTNSVLYEAFQKIIELSGHDEFDFKKMNASEVTEIVKSVFESIGINTEILKIDTSLSNKEIEKQPYYQLWHLLYSYEGDNSETGDKKLIEKLKQKFGFEEEYGKIIAKLTFENDYSGLSTKAIHKILPFLKEGDDYSIAAEKAGYNHSNSLNREELDKRILSDKLEILPKNSLRNPVVEKILNQMVNVVNAIIDEYGKPDEIRLEMARELKKSAKEREEATAAINKASIAHEKYRKILKDEFGLSYISRNDIIRYKLYKELENRGFKTLYSNTYIEPQKLFSKDFDIEHIIPQSRLFDDSFSNKTLELRSVNIEKGDKTAYDYIKAKNGEKGLEIYEKNVADFYKNQTKDITISHGKIKKLLMPSDKIPDNFIERDLRNSQYIAKKAKEMLESVVRTVNTTTGSVTDRLREDWQIINVLQELNWEKYDKLGLTYFDKNRDGKPLRRIKDWTKRNDHRHHAMDAIAVAFTKYNHVQYLNNLNARKEEGHKMSKNIFAIEQKETYKDERGKIRFKPPMPLDIFREEVTNHLQNTLISFKAKNKVVTPNRNKIKGHKNAQKTLTPRGQLHLETIYGTQKRYVTKEEKITVKFDLETINKVAKKSYRNALLKRLQENDNDPQKAFGGKNSLSKNPLYVDDNQTYQVPEKVKLVWKDTVYTIRKDISPDLKIDKVLDVGVKRILEQRLEKYKNNPKEAFANLEENPIWLNKEKGIQIKSVTITGVANAIALHDKKDKNGNFMLDENGNKQPVDFVNTGNNHHVAIYKDAEGNLQDNVVSFFEALVRVNDGLPIVDKSYKGDDGWEFLFSMKQNEYFVFPNEKTGFNPQAIDLLDEKNLHLISPNLFRVQKFSKVVYGNSSIRDYVFRHHIETQLIDKKELKDSAFKSIKSLGYFANVIKVRINHLGKIVKVGEYN